MWDAQEKVRIGEEQYFQQDFEETTNQIFTKYDRNAYKDI